MNQNQSEILDQEQDQSDNQGVIEQDEYIINYRKEGQLNQVKKQKLFLKSLAFAFIVFLIITYKLLDLSDQSEIKNKTNQQNNQTLKIEEKNGQDKDGERNQNSKEHQKNLDQQNLNEFEKKLQEIQKQKEQENLLKQENSTNLKETENKEKNKILEQDEKLKNEVKRKQEQDELYKKEHENPQNELEQQKQQKEKELKEQQEKEKQQQPQQLSKIDKNQQILEQQQKQFDKLFEENLESKNKEDYIIISKNKHSIYDFNYNPTYISLYDGRGEIYQEGLILRVQKRNNLGFIEPSILAMTFSKLQDKLFSELNQIVLQDLDDQKILKANNQNFIIENYGLEDPRLSYRKQNKMYYLFYTAVEQSVSRLYPRLSLLVTKTPLIQNSWVRMGPVLLSDKPIDWSKSAAIIWRDQTDQVPILFWGEFGIQSAIGIDKTGLKFHKSRPFLDRRPNQFDNYVVESGPSPLLLSDGNWIFIYNSAHRKNIQDELETAVYNLGYVILDQNDPLKIIQRSDQPIFSPEMDFEKGLQNDLIKNVVFCSAAKSLNTKDHFLIFYGAADTHVATAVVRVKKQFSEQENKEIYSVEVKRNIQNRE